MGYINGTARRQSVWKMICLRSSEDPILWIDDNCPPGYDRYRDDTTWHLITPGGVPDPDFNWHRERQTLGRLPTEF